MAIFQSPLKEGSTWNLKKTGHGGSEEKSFKDVDGQTGRRKDGGWQVITKAYPKPLAQVSAKSDRSGELGVLEIQNKK